MSISSKPEYQGKTNGVQAFIQHDNGQLLIKTYLIDKDFNHIDSIHPNYLAKHVDRFVGKPYIITPPDWVPKVQKWLRLHPREFEVEKGPIEYFRTAQSKYAKGYITSVERDTSSNVAMASDTANNPRYVAYVNITDPDTKEQYLKDPGSIPEYVSAAVYTYSVSPDNPNEIYDFEPLHLAGVDYPLSGIDRAIIRGSCVGRVNQCAKNLAMASISADSSYVESKGTESLEKLTESTNNMNPTNSNDTQTQTSTAPSTEQMVTTNMTTDGKQFGQMTANQEGWRKEVDPNTVRLTMNTDGGQPFKKTEEVKPAEGNQPGQIGGKVEEPKSADKDAEIAELKAQVAKLTESVKPLIEFKANSEKTEAERRASEKRATIEMAIPEDYANSPEERKKAVEALMPLGDQELEYVLQKFVVPVTGSPCAQAQQQGMVAQAGAGRGGCSEGDSEHNSITRRKSISRLTDYAKPHVANQNKVAQAGLPNGNDGVNPELTSRILSMTSIVNSSRVSGGWRY